MRDYPEVLRKPVPFLTKNERTAMLYVLAINAELRIAADVDRAGKKRFESACGKLDAAIRKVLDSMPYSDGSFE